MSFASCICEVEERKQQILYGPSPTEQRGNNYGDSHLLTRINHKLDALLDRYLFRR